MKVYHGNILTVDVNNTICEYLIEDKGRIVDGGVKL